MCSQHFCNDRSFLQRLLEKFLYTTYRPFCDYSSVDSVPLDYKNEKQKLKCSAQRL